MKTVKLSLANIDKLSRAEMKSILAGSGDELYCGGPCGKCENACTCGVHQDDNCVKQA